MNEYCDLQARLGATGKEMARRLEISAAHWSNIRHGREWTDGVPVDKAAILAALWGETGETQVQVETETTETEPEIPVEDQSQVQVDPEPEPEPDDEYVEIPDRMKAAQRWLVWRSIANGAKKPRKVPHYCDGTTRSGCDSK